MTLKEYRTKHDVTQFDFAVRAKILPQTVNRIERGLGCSAKTAQRVIAATEGEVTLDDLVPCVDDDEADGPKTEPAAG